MKMVIFLQNEVKVTGDIHPGSYELQYEGSYTVYTNVNKKGFITDKISSSAEKECLL